KFGYVLSRHPMMHKLDFTWRFEAGTEYVCPIEQDLFQYIYENNKTTSFSMALYEYKETIPSLYHTVLEFASQYSHWIKPFGNSSSLWAFLKILLPRSSMDIICGITFSFYTEEKYQAFFNFLDESNGIFYEQWGDPVIQSLAATLFLSKFDIHFWDTVGYRVANFFTHCPTEFKKCTCRPEQNFDFMVIAVCDFIFDCSYGVNLSCHLPSIETANYRM
ncbi:hypothetical protein CU098_001442, partial [Rhizopus stolonifer]